jgi:hypothetical protein
MFEKLEDIVHCCTFSQRRFLVKFWLNQFDLVFSDVLDAVWGDIPQHHLTILVNPVFDRRSDYFV